MASGTWFPDLRDLSLRSRLLIMMSLALALTLSVGFVGLHDLVRDRIYEIAWESLEKRRTALAEFAAQNPGGESAADEMLEFRSKSHEDFFEIRDGTGRLLARSASSAGRDLAPPPTSAAGTPLRYHLQLPDGHDGIATWGTVGLPPGDERGRLVITVARETAALVLLERRIHTAMVAVAVASILATLLATAYVIGRGLEPVDRLARSAESIDPDGPRRSLDAGRLPKELSTLEQKLGTLLNRLFDARDRERRFTRSVAHELRTPLAEIRMIAEVGGMSSSVEETRASLREVSTAAGELQQIMDTLLALARYESGQEEPQAEPADIAALVRQQALRLEPQARSRSLSIDCTVPRERWAITDSSLLSRLLANLIGNAVAHAPEGSTVAVQLPERGPLTITNRAPDLTVEDVRRLGERFHRGGSGNGPGHAGLGIPLANAIAAVSHLQVTYRLDANNVFAAAIDGFCELTDAGTFPTQA
ncbi:MAG TPA: histidine kinase dimerization/phospho-acceptor domain-containing protein [Steroidobacteraceae bacterium]|nr:histidine kinase dimerization/phospho-acceptor domain-containing protein [Steroidobacteraceae bacterium]